MNKGRHLLYILLSSGLFLYSNGLLAQSSWYLGGQIQAGASLANADLASYPLTINPGLALGVRLEAGFQFHSNMCLTTGLGLQQMNTEWQADNWPVSGDLLTNISVFYLEDEHGNRISSTELNYIRYDTIQVREKVQANTVQIPLLFEYKTPFWFAAVGPVLNVPLGGMKYEGTGSVVYSALFPDLDELLFRDIPGWFSPVDLELGAGNSAAKINLDLNLKLGYRKVFLNQIELMTGLAYTMGGNRSRRAATSDFLDKIEQSTEYRSIVSSARPVRFSAPSFFVNMRKPIGAAKSSSPRSNKDCLPQDLTNLQVLYRQSKRSRRNPAFDDPEMQQLMQAASEQLDFDVIHWNAENGYLTYCSAKQTAASILPRFPADHPDLHLFQSQPDYNEHLILEFEPKNQVKDLPLFVSDEAGNTLSEFEVRLFYNGMEVYYENSLFGVSIPSLYLHPDISYELSIQAKCFEEKRLTLTEADLNKEQISVQISQKGQAFNLSIPLQIATSAAIPDSQLIHGQLQKDGQVYPIRGYISGDQLHFDDACGPELAGESKLKLQKPRGIDLNIAGQPERWEIPSMDIPIQSGKVDKEIEIRSLPDYQFIYLNLPQLEDRRKILPALKKQLGQLVGEAPMLYLFFSGVETPIVLESVEDVGDFVQDLDRGMELGSGNLSEEMDRIMQDHKGMDVGADRRYIHLRFYLNAAEYASSQQEIERFLYSFGENTREAEMYIHTDQEVVQKIELTDGELHYLIW